MEVFNLTLNQMLMMFTFILIGYILRKAKVLPEASVTTMSKLETFVFVPSLTLSNWMENCTVSTLKENYIHILYGLAIVLFSLFVAYPLSKLFVRNYRESLELDYKRNLYKYAFTFGNFGFVGNFIVLGVWGSEGLFKYLMFTLCISLICGSWGLLVLIPKEKSEAFSLKSILKRMITPPIVALFIGLMAGLFNAKAYIPNFFLDVLSKSSSCMGPVAMLLAGFVIGGYEFRNLLSDKKVYLAAILRLTVLPAIIVLILKMLNTREDIITYALICFGTPLGLNTIIYPGSFGGETRAGASMVMISHVLSVITIPIMYLIFIVLI
jgi:predicted permease